MNRVSNPGANATRVPRAMTARSPLTSSLLWRTRRRASSRIDPGGIAGGGFPCRTAKIAWKASSSYAGRARSQAYRQPRSAGSEGSDGIAHPLLLAGEAEEDCLQGGIAVGPLGPELGKGPLAAQLPVVEDADPVAELLCDLHGVGGEQDPAAALGDVALEELLDDADGSRVEVVQRLVQDEEGGLVQQGRDDEGLLPGAVGERGQGLEELLLDLERSGERGGALRDPGGGEPPDAGDVFEELPGREGVEEHRGLRHVPEQGPDPDAIGARVEAEDADRPGGRPDEADHALDRGRLSRAVRAQEAIDLSRPDGEGEVHHGRLAAVGDAQPLDDEGGSRERDRPLLSK